MGVLKKVGAQAPKAPVEVEEPTSSPEVEEAPPGEPEAASGEPEAAPEGDPSGDRDATTEEQDQYLKAMKALYTIMYGDDQAVYALLDHMVPEDKVGSLVNTAILLMQQIGQRVPMTPEVTAQVTQDALDRLIELAERVKGVKFSDDEAHAALLATQDGVSQVNHGDEGPDAAQPQAPGQAPSAPTAAPPGATPPPGAVNG